MIKKRNHILSMLLAEERTDKADVLDHIRCSYKRCGMMRCKC